MHFWSIGIDVLRLKISRVLATMSVYLHISLTQRLSVLCQLRMSNVTGEMNELMKQLDAANIQLGMYFQHSSGEAV